MVRDGLGGVPFYDNSILSGTKIGAGGRIEGCRLYDNSILSRTKIELHQMTLHV